MNLPTFIFRFAIGSLCIIFFFLSLSLCSSFSCSLCTYHILFIFPYFYLFFYASIVLPVYGHPSVRLSVHLCVYLLFFLSAYKLCFLSIVILLSSCVSTCIFAYCVAYYLNTCQKANVSWEASIDFWEKYATILARCDFIIFL